MTSLPLHPATVHLPLGLAFVIPLLAIGFLWALWTGRVETAPAKNQMRTPAERALRARFTHGFYHSRACRSCPPVA